MQPDTNTIGWEGQVSQTHHRGWCRGSQVHFTQVWFRMQCGADGTLYHTKQKQARLLHLDHIKQNTPSWIKGIVPMQPILLNPR